MLIARFHFAPQQWLRCFSDQSVLSLNKCWQVSSLGRLCSSRGSISFGSLTDSGYRRVIIERRGWYVHRIVKLIFDGPPPNDQTWQVHHRDGDPTNNALNNLEYVTPSQNVAYSYATLSRRASRHIQSRPVLWRELGSKEWSSSSSAKAAAEHFGIHPNTVSACCRNKSSAKGYEFIYKNLSMNKMDGEKWLPMRHPTSGATVAGRFVSSLGRVTAVNGHTYWGCLSSSGYYTTHVLGQPVAVHRLVAFTFLRPSVTSGRMYVNHKDLNKGNNAIDNLEYVTPAENMAHFHANASFSREAGLKPVWSKPVGSSETWTWHSSMNSAARELRVNVGNLWACVSGHQMQTSGHEFRLADAPEAKTLPGEVWRVVHVPTLLEDRERNKDECSDNAINRFHEKRTKW